MRDELEQRAKRVFSEAMEIPERAAREVFIGRECAGDEVLLKRVRELLQAAELSGGIVDKPPAELVPTDLMPGFAEGASISEKVGTTVGRYKLMEQIGEGGFGLVFVAEQQQPVRRKVALKIIKPGMDTKDVVARFEAERQALALMDHPNIAKVLDAGTTESGHPYFVMELVRGVPITQYCDTNQLTTRERLELFVSVCRAVQHAHQKGIIHRDIKPTNVLVTLHDGVPVVKVIDFGVAKALHQPLTERTIYTRFAQMIGTPIYMSPEQAEMSGLDIDTRSDIYSLGVLLYELLTGTTPLTKERLAQAAYNELVRLIREEEPPVPSTRLSQSGEALATIAAQRKSEPGKLSKLVRGDLDWITMKALEKDRTRRYESASGFAADVLRYLADEAVEASPPSRWYRLRKTARKYRGAIVTAGLVMGVLIAGVVASSVFAIREQAARGVADRNAQKANEEAEKAEQEKQRAEAEREKAEVAKRAADESALKEAEAAKKAEAETKRAEAAAASERTARDEIAVQLTRNLMEKGVSECTAGRVDMGVAYLNKAYQTLVKSESKEVELRKSLLRLLGAWTDEIPRVIPHSFSGYSKLERRNTSPESQIIWTRYRAFNPASRFMAIVGKHGQMQLTDMLLQQTCGMPFDVPEGCQEIKANADGSRLLITVEDDNNTTYGLIDTSTGRYLGTIAYVPLDAYPYCTLSPNGERIALKSPREVRLWDSLTGHQIGKTFTVSKDLVDDNERVFRSGEQSLIAAGDQTLIVKTRERSGRRRLHLLRFSDGKHLGSIGDVLEFRLNCEGNRLLTLHKQTVRLWDTTTAQAIGQPVPLHSSTRAGFSSCDQFYFTLDDDVKDWSRRYLVRWWRAENAEPVSNAIFLNGDSGKPELDISPDGTRCFVATGDTIREYRSHSGKEIGYLSFDSYIQDGTRYTPDGEALFVRENERFSVLDSTSSNQQRVKRDDRAGSLSLGSNNFSRGFLELWQSGTSEMSEIPIKLHASYLTETRELLSESSFIWISRRHAPHERVEFKMYYDDMGYKLSPGPKPTRKIMKPEVVFHNSSPSTNSEDEISLYWSGEEVDERARIGFGSGKETFLTDDEKFVQLWDHATRRPRSLPIRVSRFRGISSIAADGERVAISSTTSRKVNRGGVIAFDTTSGKTILTPLKFEFDVSLIDISSDGEKVITTGKSGDDTKRWVTQLWETKTGKLLGNRIEHDRPVLEAWFSEDAARFYTCTSDEVGVWDGKNGNPVCPPIRSLGSPWNDILMGSGKELLLSVNSTEIHRWNPQTGESAGIPISMGKPIDSISVSEERRTIALLSDRYCQAWRIATAEPVGPLVEHDAEIAELALGGDEGPLIVRDKAGITLYDMVSGKRTGKRIDLGDSIHYPVMFVLPKSDRLITKTWEGLFRLWDLKSGESVGEAWSTTNHREVEISSDQRFVVLEKDHDDFSVIETQTGNLLATDTNFEEFVLDLKFIPNTNYLVTRANRSEIRIWDYRTGKEIAGPIDYSGPIESIFVNHQKNICILRSYSMARAFDASTFEPLGPEIEFVDDTGSRASEFETSSFIGIGQEGEQIFLGRISGTVTTHSLQIFDPETGDSIGDRIDIENEEGRFEVSPKGDRIRAYDDSWCREYDAMTGEFLRELKPRFGKIVEITESPQGTLVFELHQGNPFLWNATTGHPVRLEESELKNCSGGSFAAEGQRLVIENQTGGNGHQVTIWDTVSGAQIGENIPVEVLYFPSLRNYHFSEAKDWVIVAKKKINNTMTVQCWDLKTGTQMGTKILPERSEILVSSKRGILVSNRGGEMQFIDVGSGLPLGSERWSEGDFRQSTVFGPGEESVMVSTDSGRIIEWSVPPELPDQPELVDLVSQCLSGQRIEDNSIPRELDEDELTALRARLALVGKEFVEGDQKRQLNRIRNWHADRAYQGEYDHHWFAAAYHLTVLLNEKPDDSELLTRRGIAYMEQRLWEKGLADFQKALTINPNLTEALNGLAWIRAACPSDVLRNGEEAVELAEKVVKSSPDWFDINFEETLAAAYAEVGNFDRAEEIQEQIVELLPNEVGLDQRERLALYKSKKPYRGLRVERKDVDEDTVESQRDDVGTKSGTLMEKGIEFGKGLLEALKPKEEPVNVVPEKTVK